MSPTLSTTRALLIAGLAGLTLAGCDRTDRQAPAPSESLVPLPSAQPAPGGDSTQPSPEPAADECEADKLGDYLNLLPTSDAMARIRAAVGHNRIRTINPGDAVTMDLRPDRLNIEVGVDGRIKLFRCG
jgi:hypothetical protein